MLRRNNGSLLFPLLPITLSIAAGLALCTAAPSARAASFDAEAAYTYDNNVTRAQNDADIEKDQFLSVGGGANFILPFDDNNRLVWRGFIRGEFYNKFDGLTNIAVGGAVTYQYRGSSAFTAPTYGVFLKAAIDEYSNSDLRDSNIYNLGISWRKPFTDRIVFNTVLAYNMRDSDSTVFDTKDTSLLLNIDYALAPKWALYLTYSYLKGDIVSTTVSAVDKGNAAQRLKIVDASDAINLDDVFGDSAISYRLRGRTHVATIGTNFSISEKSSLDISVRGIVSKADDSDIDYQRLQFSLAYLIRF